MSDAQPPPIPSQVPPPVSAAAEPLRDKNKEGYHVFADKIGGVPNVRMEDNLYQALAIGAFVAVGSLVGLFKGGWPGGFIAGAICGMVAGLLLSGAVLTVIGLKRKS
ncbi:hypothetical protein DES53_10595 [Roseimicrobium gellanilyticum]|uniref:Uncharacterized protein n=1 Tax=Roseimicrobium gellanilyticum TaxID=748857 RepID=A0A366HMN0_9BACT|nr:hypothetical protein [Roseimicrobium gellanilyticum]RBP43696.1 hypothetical protein DES53_10595 [Roseimicrobium gellanilyticum]